MEQLRHLILLLTLGLKFTLEISDVLPHFMRSLLHHLYLLQQLLVVVFELVSNFHFLNALPFFVFPFISNLLEFVLCLFELQLEVNYLLAAVVALR